MSTPARLALDQTAVPWLFGAALVTIAPHFLHQPIWLSAFAGLMLFWGGWLWWRNERLPGRWVLGLLVAIACGSVLIEFRTLFGRDAGVAMLVVFMTLKLLELRTRRDATVVVTLGYFLLLTHYFYSQSIPTGLWLLAAMSWTGRDRWTWQAGRTPALSRWTMRSTILNASGHSRSSNQGGSGSWKRRGRLTRSRG